MHCVTTDKGKYVVNVLNLEIMKYSEMLKNMMDSERIVAALGNTGGNCFGD